DNRESLTAIETVCGDSIAITPFLIFKGDVLLEDHFKNDLDNKIILATSASGYTNKELSMKYIKHFYNQTYKKIKGKWQMLVFDRHASHTSDNFLYYC
ncbi:uncharacterized protein K444DRAFT_516051, partial [Hyaloscypha bicolor E]